MSIDDAINDITARQHGTVEFIVDADGNVRHDVTVFTVRLDGRLPDQAFFAAASADGTFRPGDRIQIPVTKGHSEFVRIIRPSQPV